MIGVLPFLRPTQRRPQAPPVPVFTRSDGDEPGSSLLAVHPSGKFHKSAKRRSVSPNGGSGTPMRSISERYRLQARR